MGLLDNMKAKLGPAKGKVSDFAHRHEGTVHHGLEKAAHAVDKGTKGKYRDKIHSGTGKAKGAMDRLAHKGGHGPDSADTTPPRDAGGATPPPNAGGTTPPDGPPPTS
ncbi:antitoxin [Streptomyces sp. NPDC050546]|uniref:antitoxin n=1 Tax=Streptomyces sp. NPDC050546 TaxID=3365628 RepID=UPI0037BA7371